MLALPWLPVALHSETPLAVHSAEPAPLTRWAYTSWFAPRLSCQATIPPYSPSLTSTGSCCVPAAAPTARPFAVHSAVPELLTRWT